MMRSRAADEPRPPDQKAGFHGDRLEPPAPACLSFWVVRAFSVRKRPDRTRTGPHGRPVSRDLREGAAMSLEGGATRFIGFGSESVLIEVAALAIKRGKSREISSRPQFRRTRTPHDHRDLRHSKLPRQGAWLRRASSQPGSTTRDTGDPHHAAFFDR